MSDERPTLLERIGAAGASATSLEGKSSRTQRIVTLAMVALVVGFLGGAVASQRSRLPDVEWRLRPAWLVAGVLALVAFQYLHAQLWVMIIHALGRPLDGARGRMVWSVTLLARYVPANVALAVGRIALAEREGVPKRISLASIVYELGFTFAGATIVGAYFLVTLPSLEDQPLRWLALAMPVAAVAALDPRIFHTLADLALRKLGREALPLSINRGQVLGFVVAFAGSFLVAGFAVYAFAQGIHGLGDGGLGIAIGSYSVGFAASVLAFLIPGGLGAREGGMVAALSPVLPVTVALAVAVGIRLAQIGVEVAYATITPALARRGAS
ncbi:MAG: lysylphosphatidylglycerol synthase domain-containing protein [Solirubrobacteraceae bacterium]